jgi:mannosyl-oligosaccharide alpha-1,2-mannosidase
MYEKSLVAMKRNIFFRPMTRDSKDILFAGNVDSDGNTPLDELKTKAEAQHLGCFAGGMVAIAAKIFQKEEDMATARKLMEGCLWAYEATRGGVMPEIIETIPCDNPNICPWDEEKWLHAMNVTYQIMGKDVIERKQTDIGLPPGILRAKDKRYILR